MSSHIKALKSQGIKHLEIYTEIEVSRKDNQWIRMHAEQISKKKRESQAMDFHEASQAHILLSRMKHDVVNRQIFFLKDAKQYMKYTLTAHRILALGKKVLA